MRLAQVIIAMTLAVSSLAVTAQAQGHNKYRPAEGSNKFQATITIKIVPPDGEQLSSVKGSRYRVVWMCSGDRSTSDIGMFVKGGFNERVTSDSVTFTREFVKVPEGVPFTVKQVIIFMNGDGEDVPIDHITNAGPYSVVVYLGKKPAQLNRTENPQPQVIRTEDSRQSQSPKCPRCNGSMVKAESIDRTGKVTGSAKWVCFKCDKQ